MTTARAGAAGAAMVGLLAAWVVLRLHRRWAAQRGDDATRARVELQAQVTSRTRQFTELTRHLQTAREDERSRLARALHDELGSLLTTAKLDVARLKGRLGDSEAVALERLVHLEGTLNSVIALTRSITEDLRPSSLGNLGLVPALEILASEFGASAGLRVELALQPAVLAAHAQLTVFRLVQEALNNTAKHAAATTVRIRLAPDGHEAELSVADDGVGFDPAAGRGGSFGLLGMRYRVEGDGGRFAVESRPGAGTRLVARLPLLQPLPPD